MFKYAYQHRVTTLPIPFETHLFMLSSTAQFLLEFKHWKSVCFHYMSIPKMFILVLIFKYFGKVLPCNVDVINFCSKYLTSNFKLKPNFYQIVTLFKKYSPMFPVHVGVWGKMFPLHALFVSTRYQSLDSLVFKLCPRLYGWL